MRPSLEGILPKEIAYTLDAMLQEGPNVALQFVKDILDVVILNADQLVEWAKGN